MLRQIIADRTGTSCASINPEGDHSGLGVGVAFDGTNLLISCYSDSTVTAVRPSDGSQVAVHTITGASSLGALAWDSTRGLLWACSGQQDVGTIDLATDVFTSVFTTTGGCLDGLAYDGTDDTLWASGDAASTIEHYTITGTQISSTDISALLGNCGNSGIAVGGANLYLANNGCSQIYVAPKTLDSAALFATLTRRLEDLECDSNTFTARGTGAIWSIDAYDNILTAYEIPLGTCGTGGLPPTTSTTSSTTSSTSTTSTTTTSTTIPSTTTTSTTIPSTTTTTSTTIPSTTTTTSTTIPSTTTTTVPCKPGYGGSGPGNGVGDKNHCHSGPKPK